MTNQHENSFPKTDGNSRATSASDFARHQVATGTEAAITPPPNHTTTNTAISHGTVSLESTHPKNDVSPTKISAIAGNRGTWRLRYRAGEQAIPIGGQLRLSLGTVSDWGRPQFSDAADDDFCTVDSPTGLSTILESTSTTFLQITIAERALQPGEELLITLGETSGGGTGSRAQTFVEKQRRFLVSVDLDGDHKNGDNKWESLTDSPVISVCANSAARLRLLIPSMINVDQKFRALLKVEDHWGNPADSFCGTVQWGGGGGGSDNGVQFPAETVQITEADAGVKWIDGFQAKRVGVIRLTAEVTAHQLTADQLNTIPQLKTMSNSQICTNARGEHQLHWADPLGGSLPNDFVTSDNNTQNSQIADFFRYARDVAGIQFVGFQQPLNNNTADNWTTQQHEEQTAYQPGVFVPIPGFTWEPTTSQSVDSATAPRHIFSRRYNRPLSFPQTISFPQTTTAEQSADHSSANDDAQKKLQQATLQEIQNAYRNTDTLMIPAYQETHNATFLDSLDTVLEPVINVVNSQGQFEELIETALTNGQRVGFIGSSNSQNGRPGDDRPGYQRNHLQCAGLTGVYVEDVTLEAFFEAITARRVFATTGARIVLSVDVDGHSMGSCYSSAEPAILSIAVAGTAPLETVELYRGNELVYAHPTKLKPATNRVRIRWKNNATIPSQQTAGYLWTGKATFQNATIAGIKPFRCDHPHSQIQLTEPVTDGLLPDAPSASIEWETIANGFPTGVISTLKTGFDPTITTLQITAQCLPAQNNERTQDEQQATEFQISLQDLNAGPVTVDLSSDKNSSGENKKNGSRIIVDWAPESGSPMADFCVRETAPQPGINAYWLKVQQTDGETAWSSPVYADFIPPADPQKTTKATTASPTALLDIVATQLDLKK